MTFLFFLFSSARLFLLASRSFRQSTLASKFRATDPGLRIPLPHPRCSPIASASSLTNDPISSSFRPLKIFENSRHSPRCILSSSSTLLFLFLLCLKTAFRTLFPLFPGHAEFLRFFLLTPPCLGFWGFLVTTLSLGGIDRYNKINFPFSLVHPSTHGPKETEGSKFSSTSVIIRPGSNFRPVVGQAVSLFPPRSNSGGTIS